MGADERIVRADWESVRKRTDWNLQVIKWLVHQSRTCLTAKVSVVKLEAIGPVEKDRELDVWHLEHVTYTPAPPGPKREGIDQLVHTWMSEGRREDSLFEADWIRAVLLLVQSEMNGETMKWVAVHGGKGEHMIRVHVGMGVIVWPKNRMISRKVSSLIDRVSFLLPGH